jgi:hypothetical protein
VATVVGEPKAGVITEATRVMNTWLVVADSDDPAGPAGPAGPTGPVNPVVPCRPDGPIGPSAKPKGPCVRHGRIETALRDGERNVGGAAVAADVIRCHLPAIAGTT